jgi:hypothetical protein
LFLRRGEVFLRVIIAALNPLRVFKLSVSLASLPDVLVNVFGHLDERLARDGKGSVGHLSSALL